MRVNAKRTAGLIVVAVYGATLLATAGVSAQDSGLASGLLNTSQQVGGALGLAVLSTLSANGIMGRQRSKPCKRR